MDFTINILFNNDEIEWITFIIGSLAYPFRDINKYSGLRPTCSHVGLLLDFPFHVLH